MRRRFLLALLFTGIFLAHTGPIASNDYGLHLALGREIAAHGPPSTDAHSFTLPGASYPDHEWLAQLLLYEGWRLVGDGGLVALKALVAAAALVLLAHTCLGKSPGDPADLAALAAVVAAFLLTLTHSDVRPHVLGWLFAAALVALLEERRWVWIPPLLVVWANIHASVLLGAGIAVLRIGSAWSKERRGSLLAIAAACAAAPLLNPYGPGLFRAALTITGGATDFVGEWLPYPVGSGPFLLVLAVTAAAVYAWSLAKPLDPFAAIEIVGLGWLALSTSRHGPVAAIWLAPRIASLSLPLSGPVRRLLAPLFAVFPLVTGAVRLAQGDAGRFGLDRRALPVAMESFLEREGVNAPLFDDYDFGGWLVWKGRPVFVDGRTEVFRGPVLDDYRTIAWARDGWREAAARWPLGGFAVRIDRPIARALAADPHWQLVWFDDLAAVFLAPDVSPRIPRLRVLTPWGASDPSHPDLGLAELDRLAGGNPDFHGAWLIRCHLLAMKGDAAGARDALARYLALEPATPETDALGRALR